MFNLKIRKKHLGSLTDCLISISISIIALIVYIQTLTPSLSYLSPDGSELATIPYILGLAHSPGYPLYTWLGYLFSHLLPFGDAAYRINLMSATFGALGVGGLYLLIVTTLSTNYPQPKANLWMKRCIAAGSALLFAFSPDFWAQALIAEVYAPNIGLVSITLLLLIYWERTQYSWAYFLFALLFGLSLGTHLSNLGFSPAFVLFTLFALYANKRTLPQQKHTNLLASLSQTVIAGFSGFALGIAQFAWLPFRADTLNDRMMLKIAPTNLHGIFKYTLGAFPNFKFAFPLTAIPDRLVIYLELLREQYHILGISIGIIGLFSLLFRKPKTYFLFVGMYLVNVWFFIQYNVFDLEVFFIPAHFIWVIFIAFGAWEIIPTVYSIFDKRVKGIIPVITQAAIMILIISTSLLQCASHWKDNDFSNDTAVNDFYANLWEILPQDSVLVTSGGVFGYDAFYWQLVYNTRPDIFLPLLPNPQPTRQSLKGTTIYATTRALQSNRGPGAIPSDLLYKDYWQIPVLFGEQPENITGHRTSLVLYQLSDEPPDIISSNSRPQIPINQKLGWFTLMGADVLESFVESGGIIQITLYWQIPQQIDQEMSIPSLRIETELGEQTLEQHEIGFGLLSRYAREVGLDPGDTIVDRYTIVIPSHIHTGDHPLSINLVGINSQHITNTQLTMINVFNHVGTFKRWLIAAKINE